MAKEKTNMIHPCNCTYYNGGQCYNCLNGAHQLCDGTGKKKCKKRNAKRMGVRLVFPGYDKNN